MILIVLIMCFVTHNGFAQKTNVLNMPQALNSLRLENKIDTLIFKHIGSSDSISKRLSMYKIDYIYRGPQINILDSVKVDSLLIGTNVDGIIQSIIISYKSNQLVFKGLVVALGNNYGEFTVSNMSIAEKTYCWITANNYRVSLKPSIDCKNGILVLSDGNYYHLFRRTLISVDSRIDY